MSIDTEIKQQVREFYDQVGWQEVGQGLYQNARYEDLRPVAREYIHRCHLRVAGHLNAVGEYLLDAGSGPIQYPEYLEYSRGYRFRVCADLSSVALQEARKRIGDHGLFVVADVANLPFEEGVFDGVVSLHTIHHLPVEEHVLAYEEIFRTLAPASRAVVVNGWEAPALTALFNIAVRWVEQLIAMKQHSSPAALDTGSTASQMAGDRPVASRHDEPHLNEQKDHPQGTFVWKRNAAWFIREIGQKMPVEIWVWRTPSVRFLRAFIHPRWGGQSLLRVMYWLEDRFPHFLGKHGQYPLIVIRKPDGGNR